MAIGLLDGDVIAYRAAISAEDDFGDGDIIATPELACPVADRIIEDWMRQSRCKKAIICLSPRESKSTFRYKLLDSYKGTRKGSKPQVYWEVVDYIEQNYKVARIDGLEADDVMGIYATSPKLDNPTVVSIDKDIQSLPARIHIVDKFRRPIKQRRSQADYHWMLQTLTGDTVDNYKGCPGVGEKTAPRILADGYSLATWWPLVVKTFEKKGLTEEDAILQARLARILRREDWRKEEGEILLWSPREPGVLKL